MSFPFLIWTMQRTGGTALTDLLFSLSEHKKADHEPFIWDRPKPRQFWPIVSAWRQTEDLEQLNNSLDAIFSEKYLIKHCYELNRLDFDIHLMNAAIRAGYKQIMLLRRDEYSRLISKYIAESEGTWFKDHARKIFDDVSAGNHHLSPLPIDKIVEHYLHCRNATSSIRENLVALGVPFKEIYYEDLYTGPAEKRLALAHDLFDFLGFDPSEIGAQQSVIEAKIFHSGQNTRDVMSFVPNIQDVTRALANEGCFPMPVAQDDAPPPPGAVKGPRARIRAEVERLLQLYDAKGPVLEIAKDVDDLIVTSKDLFSDQPRHVMGLGSKVELDDITFHDGDTHDMTSQFADGSLGVVISNRVLPRDKKFWRTQDEIRRILAPGGLLILVAPCYSVVPNEAGVIAVGRKGNPVDTVTVTQKINGAPDFWRISPQAVKNVLFDGFEIREVQVKMVPPNVFGVGVKAP
jgi:hypothetical protein